MLQARAEKERFKQEKQASAVLSEELLKLKSDQELAQQQSSAEIARLREEIQKASLGMREMNSQLEIGQNKTENDSFLDLDVKSRNLSQVQSQLQRSDNPENQIISGNRSIRELQDSLKLAREELFLVKDRNKYLQMSILDHKRKIRDLELDAESKEALL